MLHARWVQKKHANFNWGWTANWDAPLNLEIPTRCDGVHHYSTPSMPQYFPSNFVTISLTGVLSKALTQIRTHKKPRRNVTLCKIYTKLSIPWSTWSTCLAHFPFFGWDPFYLRINKVRKQLDCLVGLQVLELRKAKHCLAHAPACEAKSSKDLAAATAGSCQTREVSWKPTPLHENIIVDVSKHR